MTSLEFVKKLVAHGREYQRAHDQEGRLRADQLEHAWARLRSSWRRKTADAELMRLLATLGRGSAAAERGRRPRR